MARRGILARGAHSAEDRHRSQLSDIAPQFFRLVDNAPEEGSSGAPAKREAGSDKPGKDIPKDDAAKEKAKAEEELREAKAALEKYGSRHFMEVFWRFVAMDDPGPLAPGRFRPSLTCGQTASCFDSAAPASGSPRPASPCCRRA
jgi:hypothetical protein